MKQTQKEPTKEELCFLPAKELIALFKAQVISPVDLLEAQIERIEALNPKLVAITAKHYTDARLQAKESQERYKQGVPLALDGLTCAIKDEIDVKGWQTTMGSLILKDIPAASQDAPIAALLRKAGAVMHVQTNVPEYYCNLVTWNRLFGICRNPWNARYTPGGSSGGGAAALAAGFTTLATGSDMGGSIRFPAAMTALYGFKPPYGRVASSLTQYESEGPMARTFDDMNLFQNALSGPTPMMISTLRPKLNYPDNYDSIKGFRVVYDSMDKWGVPVDVTIQKAMQETVTKLRSLGVEVVEMDLGFRAKDFETYANGIFSTAIGPFCFTLPQKHPKLLTPYLAALVNKYAHTGSPQGIMQAEEWMFSHSTQIQREVFEKGFQAIIMPTMCTPYVEADMGTNEENNIVTINGKPYKADTWVYSFTWPWNMLGQYPVVNVPIGKTAENIPLGMQIIANTYDDLTAFQVASNWSKIAPKYYP